MLSLIFNTVDPEITRYYKHHKLKNQTIKSRYNEVCLYWRCNQSQKKKIVNKTYTYRTVIKYIILSRCCSGHGRVMPTTYSRSHVCDNSD